MKCPNCGKELKTGQLYCESCGQEIQIVPDYDPLDELLIGREEPAEKTFSPSGKKTKNPEEWKKQGKQRVFPEQTEPEKRRAVFSLKWCLLLGGLLLCFAAFVGTYRLTTRENSYSWQLRRGKSLVEKEAYEEAVPYLKKADELQAEMEGAAV